MVCKFDISKFSILVYATRLCNDNKTKHQWSSQSCVGVDTRCDAVVSFRSEELVRVWCRRSIGVVPVEQRGLCLRILDRWSQGGHT